MLGNKLKEGRITSGITQEQLAERLGLSQSSISNYERNHRIPKKEYRAKICLMLDCSIISLLGIQSKNKTSEIKEIITTEEEKSIISLIKEWFLKNKLLLS